MPVLRPTFHAQDETMALFFVLKFTWYVIWGAFHALFSCCTRRSKLDLRGDVCVVTGAAQGLGRRIALQLAGCGATLILWDIDGEKVRAVASEIREGGRQAYAYVVDCSKREEVYRVAAQVLEEVGNVAVLVNNAGIGHIKTYVSGDLSDEEIVKTFSVNIFAHFWTVRAFLPSMMENDYGYIVNIASSTAYTAVPYLSHYCASKAAVRSFSESLRYELLRKGKNGITVTCVYPGAINTTAMNETVPMETFKEKNVPSLSPEEVARNILHAMGEKRCSVFMPASGKLLPFLERVIPQVAYDLVIDKLADIFEEIANKEKVE